MDAGCLLRSLLLALGRELAGGLSGHLLQGLQGPRRNAHANATDPDRLQIDLLFSLGGDVGVAARIANIGALAGKDIDAGHKGMCADHT